ncbi:hypothetical protein ACFFRR_004626 [Megaselia abdita]
MLKIVLILFFFTSCKGGYSDGNGTWTLTEVREDSRGKMHRFRFDNFKDEFVCKGCKNSKSSLDAHTAIGKNIFGIIGLTENETEAVRFSETFMEVIHFYYCKNSTTACVDYKESTDKIFENKIIEVKKHFKYFHMIKDLITQGRDILDDTIEVAVCEISKKGCGALHSEDDIILAVKNVVETLYVGNVEKLIRLLLDIIHNRIIRGRCFLECNPF